MLDFLPEKLVKVLTCEDNGILFEVRIRSGCPILAKYSKNIVKFDKFIFNTADIESIILKLCKGSIHSFEEQIKHGYITSDLGERVGLSGEVVKENGKIIAIKNITSLCVRVPNAIFGVSNKFYENYYKNNCGSVLVLSKTGVGKTTFIRDLSLNISSEINNNVVIVDERNEIALKSHFKNLFNGKQVDVLTYSDKDYGFNQAVRALNPNFIITDELMGESDLNSVINAIYCGVSVIATAHANSPKDFFNRFNYDFSKNNKIFDYFVVISNENGVRMFDCYDKNLNKLCLH